MKAKLISFLLIIFLISCTNTHTNFDFKENSNTTIDNSNNIIDSPNNIIITENSKIGKTYNTNQTATNQLDFKNTNNTEKNTVTFHYQLQNTDYNNLKKLDVDYLIIDIDDSKFSSNQIKELKEDKKILSYLSIGEAEDYRSYWQSSWHVGYPNFIDRENPDWKGNYKVKYWEDEWQNIILKEVRTIMNQGYDGIYLDIIDVYEYYNKRDTAAIDMIEFVYKIKEQAKAINPDAIIFGQNAVELYDYAKYKNSIDGIGSEDTWYNDNTDQLFINIQQRLKYLDRARRDNKLIFAIEYPTEQYKICTFYKKCKEEGFSCLVTNRILDKNKPLVCQDSYILE